MYHNEFLLQPQPQRLGQSQRDGVQVVLAPFLGGAVTSVCFQVGACN